MIFEIYKSAETARFYVKRRNIFGFYITLKEVVFSHWCGENFGKAMYKKIRLEFKTEQDALDYLNENFRKPKKSQDFLISTFEL